MIGLGITSTLLALIGLWGIFGGRFAYQRERERADNLLQECLRLQCVASMYQEAYKNSRADLERFFKLPIHANITESQWAVLLNEVRERLDLLAAKHDNSPIDHKKVN